MSAPPRKTPYRSTSRTVTDPVEIAAAEERCRQAKQTAVGRVGHEQLFYVPLPELAQYVVELDDAERQEFLTEFVARLPTDVVAPLLDALRGRLGAPTA